MEEKLTVREACRRRMPLGGADAQALEHGMTQLEEENKKLRKMYDDLELATRVARESHPEQCAHSALRLKDEYDKHQKLLENALAEIEKLKDERESDACWDAHCERHAKRERALEQQLAEAKGHLSGPRQFPIMIGYRGTPGPCPSSIPWDAIAPYDAQARQNHGGQSLERLAERGGLSPGEAYAVMTGKTLHVFDSVNFEAMNKEACAFLDNLVREGTIAKLVAERDAFKGNYQRVLERADAANRQIVELKAALRGAHETILSAKGESRCPCQWCAEMWECVGGCGKKVYTDGAWCFAPCKPF